jgi:hypothetical protein
MEAGVGYRVSYAWRSLSSARGVLRMGLRWHIGNGPMASCYGSRVPFINLVIYWIKMSGSLFLSIGPLIHRMLNWCTLCFRHGWQRLFAPFLCPLG